MAKFKKFERLNVDPPAISVEMSEIIKMARQIASHFLLS